MTNLILSKTFTNPFLLRQWKKNPWLRNQTLEKATYKKANKEIQKED